MRYQTNFASCLIQFHVTQKNPQFSLINRIRPDSFLLTADIEETADLNPEEIQRLLDQNILQKPEDEEENPDDLEIESVVVTTEITTEVTEKITTHSVSHTGPHTPCVAHNNMPDYEDYDVSGFDGDETVEKDLMVAQSMLNDGNLDDTGIFEVENLENRNNLADVGNFQRKGEQLEVNWDGVEI